MRQRYDDVGLPCRKTIGSPVPISTYAMCESSTGIVKRSARGRAEMSVSMMLSVLDADVGPAHVRIVD